MEPLAGIIFPPEGQLQKNAGYAKPGYHACPRIDPLNLDTSYLNFRLFSKFLVFSWQEDKILLPYTRTSLMINDSVCAFL